MRQYCKKYRQNEQNPFAVVSWQDDFLYKIQEVVDCFIQEQNISMQDIVLVFPNARPKRYLTARYKKSAGQKQQAGILPQIYTSSEFYTLCLHHFERGQSLFSEQEPLDRYAKLYEIVKNILQKKRNTHFSASVEIRQLEASETDVSYKKEENGVLQMAKFYPWAESLDMLFEECFQHLIFPRNIEYADGEVSPFAQSLLADLKEIFTEYVRSMQEERQSTPAYGLFRTARYIQSYYQYQDGKTPDMADMPFEKNKGDAEYFSDFTPYLLQGKCIIFAGFVSVSQAEEVILKYFWERGACLCFHTDSRLVTDIRALHYSCEEHGKWLQKWRAEAYLLSAGGERKPEISFLPAYDVHSQLQSLKKDIMPHIETAQERDDYCAVVLPNPSLLMPVLHELPNKNINISVGYPIQRTLLWQFMECIFTLQLQKKENADGYSYRAEDLRALLRHPYAKMLLGQGKQGNSKARAEQAAVSDDNFSTWRKVLYYAEKKLAEQGVYADCTDFVQNTLFDLDNENLPYALNETLEEFIDNFFALTVFSWEQVENLRDIGERLYALIDFLIRYGAGVWYRFPLDKEGLVRFLQNTVPSVMQNGMAEKVLPLKVLYGIVEQLVHAERVPFEADPLTGLQVLGMLETRLLRFENVFVLDCIESALPAQQNQDPLMPDSLRNMLGLPDRHSREILVAHTFYRLINGAENVYCYWQEGVLSSEIQSSKNIRSRFIEELIWEKEKNNKKEGISAPFLRAVDCGFNVPERRKKRGIPMNGVLFAALENVLAFGLSAKGLNAYLQCPVKFYYQYLAKIGGKEEPEAGDNYSLFGTKIHELLKEQYQGKSRVKHDEAFARQLLQGFHEKFNKKNWQECCSAESYFMLQESGKYFLNKYCQEMPSQLEILALEQQFSHLLQHGAFSVPVHLIGYADRIDKRDDSYWIVDYKTTKINKKQAAIWKNEILLHDLAEMNENWQEEKAERCFEELAAELSDIQLPFYLYLFARDFIDKQNRVDGNANINASWIFLSERKEPCELALVSENVKSGRTTWEILKDMREKHMDTILHFILNHMAKEKEWKCKEGKYCGYCPFAEYC